MLDWFGYDEVWFGEYYFGGYELIVCLEVFIVVVVEWIIYIWLGIGVVLLFYYYLLMVVDCWVLLDYLICGWVMFGIGFGVLLLDVYMMGIDLVE